jgi:hypothetical protein
MSYYLFINNVCVRVCVCIYNVLYMYIIYI